ncbi:MAG TPA: type I-C CRISPR-associated protein Cas8c/Csd1 [Rhodopseudomonas sp.]|uniref:type I-C CRISPR-associated protein Cas8c/Csd1 n=1 Tax=Rhodopseudomonas sp. TaxID=1078 RepID=UPI002EDB71E8
MSALAALVRAYDRLATRRKVPAFGYSQEKIGFLISLNPDGTPVGLPIDLREGEGRKKQARMMTVPAAFKRPGVTPRAFFLWDNTAYALGVTASDGKDGSTRLEAFRERHRRELAGTKDEGLLALLKFIEAWRPEDFERLGWPEEMKDQNVVFALESERRQDIRIHDRPAARELWAKLSAEPGKVDAVCLVTGERGPVARLHSAIKGVWDAQSSGASIVSFNLDAFTSYGHEQGDNAPISEAAAFAYTTALNHFLEKGSGHRLQIGDASTVFWADAETAEAVADAEDIFASFLAVNEKQETAKVAAILQAIHDGRPIEDIKPKLPEGVRFFVLALAPNAARLSVRFYIEDDFGVIAERYAQHVQRMRIEPPPREPAPSMWRLLIETATLRKTENVVPKLAGDWMRAILTGAPYPLTLLSQVLMRLRADHDVNALRVAIIKSVLIRNFADSFDREVPVSLDPDNKEPGYLLGRLFSVYEQIQSAALGRNVNATIKDKFYGAAASQPRKIYPMLDKGSKPHLSKITKDNKGLAIVLERRVGEIMETMSPGADPFPSHLPDKQQGLFALGYYHQRNDFFAKTDSKSEKPVIEEPTA